jgi:hypothetical protein
MLLDFWQISRIEQACTRFAKLDRVCKGVQVTAVSLEVGDEDSSSVKAARMETAGFLGHLYPEIELETGIECFQVSSCFSF